MLPSQPTARIDIGLGGLTIDGVNALSVFEGGTTDSLRLGGVLGVNVFRQFSLELNYRDHKLDWAMAIPIVDVEEPGVSSAFKLEGGGAVALSPTTTVTFCLESHFCVSSTSRVSSINSSWIAVPARRRFAQSFSPSLLLMAGLLSTTSVVSTANGPKLGVASRMRIVSLSGETVVGVPMLDIGDDSSTNWRWRSITLLTVCLVEVFYENF